MLSFTVNAAATSVNIGTEPMIRTSHLPLTDLSDEGFEIFCLDLLKALHPETRVHRYGVRGNKQFGVDILQVWPDGSRWTYQCKRYARFEPNDLRAAVAAHTFTSKRQTLLLACRAQSSLRDEMLKQPTWELWDEEDISRKVLDVPRDVACRLLDHHLPGMREAFLGIPLPSSWSEPSEFFSLQVGANSPFTHCWHMVGRERELATLQSFLDDHESRVALILGNPGMGKSRLLRAVSDEGGDEGMGFAITSLHERKK